MNRSKVLECSHLVCFAMNAVILVCLNHVGLDPIFLWWLITCFRVVLLRVNEVADCQQLLSLTINGYVLLLATLYL